ncbi:MAG: pirin family protein [Planctomycetes bacterium]|nr:pirin family protein [Planctomycetota bacterium]
MKRVQQLRHGQAMHWVGDGFPVRTFFSYAEPLPFSPFLLLDYAAPNTFAKGTKPRGVGPHPHRGFATVTLALQGEIAHRDSAGHGGTIGPGDVQWMTAARGVVHEELHSDRFTSDGGVLEMVQLWVNLPARAKMTPPSYQDLRADAIPTVALPGEAGSARVVAGTLLGATGPARTVTPVELWDVTLRAGRPTVLPFRQGHTTLLLVTRGEVVVAGEDVVPANALAVLDRFGTKLVLQAKGGDARVLVLGGEPIDEPVVGHGPFVMNTWPEIRQAVDDFQSGRMGRLE